VFDTLDDEHGRTAHLEGQVSAALGEIAQTMAGSAPVISEVNLLGIKAPEDHEPQPFDKRLGINSIPEMPALTGVEPRSSKETT
jgi:hypothetical protein